MYSMYVMAYNCKAPQQNFSYTMGVSFIGILDFKNHDNNIHIYKTLI